MEKEMLKRVGETLRELREENNMTQKDVGEAIGISQFSISRYENGDYAMKLDVLSKLSELFSVTISFLLGEEELKKTEEVPEEKKYPTSFPELSNDVCVVIVEEGVSGVDKAKKSLFVAKSEDCARSMISKSITALKREGNWTVFSGPLLKIFGLVEDENRYIVILPGTNRYIKYHIITQDIVDIDDISSDGFYIDLGKI